MEGEFVLGDLLERVSVLGHLGGNVPAATLHHLTPHINRIVGSVGLCG